MDNSASMIDEQQKLINTFQVLTNILGAAELDYRLVLITTDITTRGAFLGPVLTGTTPGLGVELERQITLLREDLLCSPEQDENLLCYQEQGLTTAKLALERERALPEDQRTFLRDQARLAIVVVSDDDDMTEGNNATGPTGDRTLQINFIKGLKTATNQVTISALVADGSEHCNQSNWQNGVYVETAHNIERVGTHYLEAAHTTNGVVGAICDQDFTPFLTRLGSLLTR